MKKIIAAAIAHVLIIVGIITTFGVLSGTKATSGAEKFTGVLEHNVTLKILENDTAIKQGYFGELLTAFNAKYAEYGIVAVDANMNEAGDLENDGPYGYGPDVLYQANDRLMRYVDGKHIQPLPINKLECYDKIDDEAWNAYKATLDNEDFYCGVPVNIQGPLLYYRKDLLPKDWETSYDKNSNKVPDMVENWNDLYKFSLERKKVKGKYGYMKSLFDPYFACGYLFSYGGYAFGKNDTDSFDIGFSKNGAENGAAIMRQLATVMNEECIDDSITRNAYSKIGNGDYFATMTTPDVYSMFIDEMTKNGMTKEQAIENLVVAEIPKLPKSGDLTEENPELIPSKMMGGVNGYAMSSYTKAPNASLAFIDFATSYEMIEKRNEILGVVPARADVAEKAGGLSTIINANLKRNEIAVMPSIRAVAQLWTPLQTFFTDIAKDPYRKSGEMKYLSLDTMKAGLEKVDKQIYDAIHTLQ